MFWFTQNDIYNYLFCRDEKVVFYTLEELLDFNYIVDSQMQIDWRKCVNEFSGVGLAFRI